MRTARKWPPIWTTWRTLKRPLRTWKQTARSTTDWRKRRSMWKQIYKARSTLLMPSSTIYSRIDARIGNSIKRSGRCWRRNSLHMVARRLCCISWTNSMMRMWTKPHWLSTWRSATQWSPRPTTRSSASSLRSTLLDQKHLDHRHDAVRPHDSRTDLKGLRTRQ